MVVFFSHVRTLKGRKAVERPYCTWAYRRLRTGERAMVAGNLLHVYSYQGVNIIHTKCWMQIWLNNTQNVAFLF